MPTSNYQQISKIMGVVCCLKPKTVLDVGVGFGKYGFLCREYLDLADGRNEYTFRVRVDGIEAHAPYLTPVHGFVYNHIYVGDAVQVTSQLSVNYDLVLAIDVLEHFDKERGIDVVRQLLSVGKGVLVSVPKNIGSQQDAFGNPYETHRAQWTIEDFGQFECCHWVVKDSDSHISYLGNEREVKLLQAAHRMNVRRSVADALSRIWVMRCVIKWRRRRHAERMVQQ